MQQFLGPVALLILGALIVFGAHIGSVQNVVGTMDAGFPPDYSRDIEVDLDEKRQRFGAAFKRQSWLSVLSAVGWIMLLVGAIWGIVALLPKAEDVSTSYGCRVGATCASFGMQP